jgi:hypothetical protein
MWREDRRAAKKLDIDNCGSLIRFITHTKTREFVARKPVIFTEKIPKIFYNLKL